MCELDPLTIAVQQEVDADNSFNSSHIFYKLIYNGLKSAHANPRNFQWPNELVDFANSIEAQGGARTCNLLRGPGMVHRQVTKCYDFWQDINIPFPSRTTRLRRKVPAVKSSGVLVDNVKNLQLMCNKVDPLILNPSLQVTPICLSRDAMAIKPSGDLDIETNQIIGLTEPIDINFVKANPVPDPEVIRAKMYTEAGAIIATTLDKECGLLIANDFLTSRTNSTDVFATLSEAISCVQCCEACLRHVTTPIVSSTQVQCKSTCEECLKAHQLCDECAESYHSIYPQLRPCSRCVQANIRCNKLAVLAVSMDCEANNAHAMKRIDSKDDEMPTDMLLVHTLPDAVHAGKKVFRASANWWLRFDGYRINNVMLRTLRQFDNAASTEMRPHVSDTALRNRDRMDYGSILECTDPNLAKIIDDLTKQFGTKMTSTLLPDPFWKSKTRGLISSTSDICTGIL